MARVLALTLGEPAGIGPDIAIAAWRRRQELDLPPFYLLADPDFLRRRAEQLGDAIALAVVEPAAAEAAFRNVLPVVDIGIDVTAVAGQPDDTSAPAALAAIRRAVDDVCAGAAAAVVTNPVAKNILYRSGFTEPGTRNFSPSLPRPRPGPPYIR